MGRAISYCFLCASQVREEAFAQAKAYRFQERVCCAGCAPEALKSLPADLVQALLKEISGTRPAPPPPPGRRASGSSTPALKPLPSASPKSTLPWIIAGAAGLAAVAALVVLTSTPAPPPPAPASPPAPARTKAVVETPQRQALKKAQAHAREHPDDFDGQIRQFEAVVLMGGSTAEAREAMRAIEILRARNREAVALGLAELERAMAEPLSRREYGRALSLLETVRSRRLGTQWQLALDKREREIREAGQAAFAPLLEEGLAARRSGDTTTLQAVRAQVVALGLPRPLQTFDDAIAALPPPPSSLLLDDFERAPEGLQFVPGWEFPGAKGGFEPDRQTARSGTTSYKLTADFRGGGAYVGIWKDIHGLPEGQDVREIRFWAKTSTVARLGVRIADGTGQVHQKNGGVELTAGTDWREVVIRVADVVGGERWAGANDGRWHPVCKGFGLNIGNNSFDGARKTGEMWIDDLRVILGPAGK